MTRTFILSHETLCQLLEAHASLAAWYFQLSDALRAAGGEAEPPDEARRKAFLEQLATSFPEVADAARSIEQPQPFIPPPVFTAPPAAVPSPVEPAAVAAPPAADIPTQPDASGAAPVTPQGAAPPPPPPVQPPLVSAEQQPSEAAATGGDAAAAPVVPVAPVGASTSAEDAVAPPPMVDPKKVRYD